MKTHDMIWRAWRAAAATMVGLAVWCGPGLLQAGGLVPYKGTIEGEVTIGSTGDIVAPPAQQISSHLGKGVQVYDELVITTTKTGLRAEGLCRSIAANGDELQIQFVMEGPFDGDETVAYVGYYEILPDGTGRFAYNPAMTELGRGTLAGVAEITTDPLTGVTTIAFRHDFKGTIYIGRARKEK